MPTSSTGNKPLEGRVFVITGAGRGLGASYAKEAALMGAKIVVNDIGKTLQGESTGESPADEVVREIIAAGGEAIADTHDITDYDGAQALIDAARRNAEIAKTRLSL